MLLNVNGKAVEVTCFGDSWNSILGIKDGNNMIYGEKNGIFGVQNDQQNEEEIEISGRQDEGIINDKKDQQWQLNGDSSTSNMLKNRLEAIIGAWIWFKDVSTSRFHLLCRDISFIGTDAKPDASSIIDSRAIDALLSDTGKEDMDNMLLNIGEDQTDALVYHMDNDELEDCNEEEDAPVEEIENPIPQHNGEIEIILAEHIEDTENEKTSFCSSQGTSHLKKRQYYRRRISTST